MWLLVESTIKVTVSQATSTIASGYLPKHSQGYSYNDRNVLEMYMSVEEKYFTLVK